MEERIQFLDNFKAIDIGTWIADHLSFLPSVTLASHGDTLPNTGAAPMLDQLQFEYPDKQPDAGL